MRNLTIKSAISRHCLISYILLCSLFTSQTAFSQQFWQPKNMVVAYYPKDHFIDFNLLVYNYNCLNNLFGYIIFCDFSYSEDGDTYKDLIKLNLKQLSANGYTNMRLSDKKTDGNIQIFNSVVPISGSIWNNKIIRELRVELKIVDEEFFDGYKFVKYKNSYFNFRWYLPTVDTRVKYIKIGFSWKAIKGVRAVRMENVYTLHNTSSKSNSLKSNPTILCSQISNNVKVYKKDADAITVTGADPGDYIKIYTVAGVGVKSVVANDDVVNIKLPTNQIYVVDAGQTRHKVAL